MNTNDGVPDPYAPRRRRRLGLWIALAVTAIAVPFVIVDNLPGDDGESDPLNQVRVVTPVEAVPSDRAETGPAKGVSVVTSSTTSSTLPITTTTTTTTPA
ncbi:MAG: hypothetical protein OSA99_06110 [Acidimicrobiales bacterium]|nr:hypothetical protein [Acidimicrobiales bacterium]